MPNETCMNSCVHCVWDDIDKEYVCNVPVPYTVKYWLGDYRDDVNEDIEPRRCKCFCRKG